MVASSMQQPPPGAVLYVDHARHLTPLTLTYHATASRHLTSGRSDVVPPSTTAEIDSAYCPRCLTFCDSATAGSTGVCQNTNNAGGCKDCPVCFSPVKLSIDERVKLFIDENTSSSDPASSNDGSRLVCHYLCGHCQWSSRECGVTSNADKLLEYSSSEDVDVDKKRLLAIADISKELELCLQNKLEEKNKVGDDLFKSITNMWGQREQDEQRRKRMVAGTTSSSSRGGVGIGKESWSPNILEQTLLEDRKGMDSMYIDSKENSDSAKETKSIDDATDKPGSPPTPQQIAAQMTLSSTTPQSRSDLFPLPVSFRTRVSRRCRAELSAGRTGILIKPKLNPLEGDSSLRAGHGQWWKKDSSAVHVVPRVQLCRHGAADGSHEKYAALLKVKNPTLNMIRLRFSGPSNTEEDDKSIFDERELQNVLVDPFTETIVQAKLCNSDATASLSPTDFFELDPADDPFLDIGKGQEEDPSDVRDWDALSALDGMGDGEMSRWRLVATRGDTAWIELVLCNSSVSENALSGGKPDEYLAVPFTMQIEVGNGSWEASLIKHRSVLEGEKDIVALDLVTLLR